MVEKLINSLKQLENFSGGNKKAYSNEAQIRHFIHKILMKSLKDEKVYMEEE